MQAVPAPAGDRLRAHAAAAAAPAEPTAPAACQQGCIGRRLEVGGAKCGGGPGGRLPAHAVWARPSGGALCMCKLSAAAVTVARANVAAKPRAVLLPGQARSGRPRTWHRGRRRACVGLAVGRTASNAAAVAAGADAADDRAEPREGRAAGRAVGLRPQHRPAAAGPADGGAEGARFNFIVKERQHNQKRPSFASALRAQLRARHCRRQAAAERVRAVRHACALHVALEH